jgi:hypothetical protein
MTSKNSPESPWIRKSAKPDTSNVTLTVDMDRTIHIKDNGALFTDKNRGSTNCKKLAWGFSQENNENHTEKKNHTACKNCAIT